MTSASWDLYLETLNFPTLTVMVNLLKWQGPTSPRTKLTKKNHHPNQSYLLQPNVLTSMQEPSSPSPFSSLMLSTGLSICEGERKKRVKIKWFRSCHFVTILILKIMAKSSTEQNNCKIMNSNILEPQALVRSLGMTMNSPHLNLLAVCCSPLKAQALNRCCYIYRTLNLWALTRKYIWK